MEVVVATMGNNSWDIAITHRKAVEEVADSTGTTTEQNTNQS